MANRVWQYLSCIANHLFYTVRISMNYSNSILVHFFGQLFHAIQTLANQCRPNYDINMISSNILSLGSFFSQNQPLDTLWVQFHYTLTAQRKFQKQNNTILDEPLRIGNLSITNTIFEVLSREVSLYLCAVLTPDLVKHHLMQNWSDILYFYKLECRIKYFHEQFSDLQKLIF